MAVGGADTRLLVIDVGTSGVRAVVTDGAARILHAEHRELPPSTPAPGLVEFDPSATAGAALGLARRAIAATGRVGAVGITNQRSSTVAWDRATGEPVGPGLGWQDQRTLPACERLFAEGLLIAPNLTATKAAWLLEQADPSGRRDLCVGTIDTWIAWTLSQGALHVTDPGNAGATGLATPEGVEWSDDRLRRTGVPRRALPEIVDSSGVLGPATALEGAPPIAGIAGDQQASLLGQGCVRPGMAKITFGSGGMLDLCVGPERPAFDVIGSGGSASIIAWRRQGAPTWALEGILLAAGTHIEWLREIGVIGDSSEAHGIASSCASSDGVVFVPALLGLGTPYWDFRARGALLGVGRSTGRAQIVRAVLEGIAQRAADLVEAAEADGGLAIGALRIDGGMSANPTFVQAVADATGRPIEVSPVLEATSLGAAFLAGLAIGVWSDWDEVAATWAPRERIEPLRAFDRARWKDACERAKSLPG